MTPMDPHDRAQMTPSEQAMHDSYGMVEPPPAPQLEADLEAAARRAEQLQLREAAANTTEALDDLRAALRANEVSHQELHAIETVLVMTRQITAGQR